MNRKDDKKINSYIKVNKEEAKITTSRKKKKKEIIKFKQNIPKVSVCV